jgi:hypothetical protein
VTKLAKRICDLWSTRLIKFGLVWLLTCWSIAMYASLVSYSLSFLFLGLSLIGMGSILTGVFIGVLSDFL